MDRGHSIAIRAARARHHQPSLLACSRKMDLWFLCSGSPLHSKGPAAKIHPLLATSYQSLGPSGQTGQLAPFCTYLLMRDQDLTPRRSRGTWQQPSKSSRRCKLGLPEGSLGPSRPTKTLIARAERCSKLDRFVPRRRQRSKAK